MVVGAGGGILCNCYGLRINMLEKYKQIHNIYLFF